MDPVTLALAKSWAEREFGDLRELGPHIEAILDSRIVEHNLDVADPPTGWYVRWENGLQVCWNSLSETRSTTTATGALYRDDDATMWTFPAAFITNPVMHCTPTRSTDDGFRLFFAPHSVAPTSVTYRDVATASASSLGRNDRLLALGRWK